MGKPTLVPVTASVLDWAVKESGYEPQKVAAKVGVSTEKLAAWAHGVTQPTLTEFRKLANVLKRTPATFLLPGPPAKSAASIEFRRPSGIDRKSLNATERVYLREARRLQELLGWLQNELQESASPLPHIRIDADNPEIAADRARTLLLPVLSSSASAWSSPTKAFHSWRRGLEGIGVLILSFPMRRDAVRGFSIWDARLPVIAVNTAWRVEARTYTLFHEFGHLLTRTASACIEAGRRFARPADGVERWCEEFSAAVLLPRQEVERFLARDLGRPANLPITDLDVPSRLATRFKVSLRAATIRLIEMKLAKWDLYNQIPVPSDDKPKGGGGRGRDRSEIREGQYGDRAVGLFVRALHRDILGRTDVLDALNISDLDLSKLERKSPRTA